MKASTGRTRGVLIIVENLPVPFDRRVWSEATSLVEAGYAVSVISPAQNGFDARREFRDGVHIYRHPLVQSDDTATGYFREYVCALYWQMRLAIQIWRERGFDVIHACNPPDLSFIVAATFKALFGVRFIFDHHDLSPELYEAKFEKRGVLWLALRLLERLTFMAADVSLATNQSYREIAVGRGGMKEEDVFVVRSGPRLDRLELRAPNPEHKKGARFLVGYVGVIGRQEGLDLLIEAALRLKALRGSGDVRYAIVGGGPKLEEMRELARLRGVDHAFDFYGRAPDDMLLDILNTADVCVNPDRACAMNDKSTMNKIMEYMALKKPIVQFDLLEGRRTAGGASLYAARDDPDDFAAKLNALLNQPRKRARMGEIGRERVLSRLSWDASVPALLAAYARALAKRPRGASASAMHEQFSPAAGAGR
jgi:glycosyltransferase involved in cell wall biosynthesis